MPQRGGRHGENKIVRDDLPLVSLRSADCDSHLVSTLSNRQDNSPQIHRLTEHRGKTCGQPIIAAHDSIELTGAWCVSRELIHKREQGQILRVGQEKPAKALHEGARLPVGVDVIKPLGHRQAGQRPRNWTVPTLFAQPIGLDPWLTELRDPRTKSTDGGGRLVSMLCGPSPDKCKPSSKDGRQRQPQLLSESTDRFMITF